MAVPKKRTSKSRKGMRRAHDGLKFTENVVECEACGELKRRHHVCDACGTYRGLQIFAVAEETEEASEEISESVEE